MRPHARSLLLVVAAGASALCGAAREVDSGESACLLQHGGAAGSSGLAPRDGPRATVVARRADRSSAPSAAGTVPESSKASLAAAATATADEGAAHAAAAPAAGSGEPLVLGIMDGSELSYVDKPASGGPSAPATAARWAASLLGSGVAAVFSGPAAGHGRPQGPERSAAVLGLLDVSESHHLDAALERSIALFNSSLLGRSSPAQRRSKSMLMAIDLFPPLWMAGADRLYLGDVRHAAAKFAVCVLTCGLGGLVWGLADLVIVAANALRKEDRLSSFGMEATFEADDAPLAFALACIDLAVAACLLGLLARRSLEVKWRGAARAVRFRESTETLSDRQCADEGPAESTLMAAGADARAK